MATSTQKRNDAIALLYRQGLSLRQIGERHGLSGEGVRKTLVKAGIRRRQRGRQANYLPRGPWILPKRNPLAEAKAA